MSGKRIILAGGSGFLGSALAKKFRTERSEVIVLTRRPRGRSDGVTEVAWDGKTMGEWARLIDGASAVINLTGKNINCVFTPENRRLIIESRVQAVRAITAAIQNAATPPSVLVQASAIGFYGDTGSNSAEEATANGTGFLAEACHAWEAALDPSSLPATRCVTLRIGLVLDVAGGALLTLTRLARWFLGGSMGHGRQFISWIHLKDLCAIVSAALANEKWQGVYNAVAPNPLTNAEFMRELRRAVCRPWSPPTPSFALRLLAPLIGTDPALALESQRVMPQRLLASGFQFEFPELGAALREIESRAKKAKEEADY